MLKKFRETRISSETLDRVTAALIAGQYVTGPAVEAVEKKMAEIAGTRYAVAVSSGTIALTIALEALHLPKGSQVLIPDLTFVACTLAARAAGLQPVFCDVNIESYVMTVDTVRAALSKHPDVKAILAVKLGGVEVKGMESFKLPVIYDSAHIVEHSPKRTSCFSFHPSKVISGLDGGCITTDDAAIYRRARTLRNFGFFEGTRVSYGSGHKGNMTHISAILIEDGLKTLKKNIAKRSLLLKKYNRAFHSKHTGLGMFMISSEDPEAVVAFSNGLAIRHYPVTQTEMFVATSKHKNAYKLSRSLISLPFNECMRLTDVDAIATMLKKIKLTFKTNGQQKN